MTVEGLLLDLIAAHDGQWSWYQLDRALSVRRLDVSNLLQRLNRLERDGLIAVLSRGKGQPRYALTDKGRARLRESGASPEAWAKVSAQTGSATP